MRNCLDCMTVGSGGVYSNSVLWSQIMKYLLVVKSETFFKASATLTKDLGMLVVFFLLCFKDFFSCWL